MRVEVKGRLWREQGKARDLQALTRLEYAQACEHGSG
jgi:hypothetical protein